MLAGQRRATDMGRYGPVVAIGPPLRRSRIELMVAAMASNQGSSGAKKIHGQGPTTPGRMANIAIRQRPVIQAQTATHALATASGCRSSRGNDPLDTTIGSMAVIQAAIAIAVAVPSW
jgi:hypothetical protein